MSKSLTIWVLCAVMGTSGGAALAQDRTPAALLQLPVEAQYCAILRALSTRPDPRCPDAVTNGQSRGIVFTGDPDSALAEGQQTRGLASTEYLSPQEYAASAATRGFSRAAIPASGNPGEKGYFIQFAFDSDILGDDYKAHLSRLTEVLNTDVMKNSCIKVIGHTDTVGSAQYNQTLSDRRALSVQSYMTAALGLDAARVNSEGRGETAPLLDIPGGHPKNRRVEILSRSLALGCG